jgi:cytoplasmic iron level regulating protein YaaA (DUF328/UPF0246 family)
MLFLLSPAKSLDYETPVRTALSSRPLFTERSSELIGILKRKSWPEVAELMSLSEPLSRLNVQRYGTWAVKPADGAARQAVLAFNGDVYGGLAARTLDDDALGWAQAHIAILSGLYGVLRPMDQMQPYRLEMGTRLPNKRGADLYDFWRPVVARYLNQALMADVSPVVVNLASQEYFKAVDTKALKARVIECVFEDWKTDRFKIISFHAKRARGLMARFAVDERINTPGGLERFNYEGYQLDEAGSKPDRLLFRRRVD